MLLNISDNPKHKKRARLLATLWTLLIFVLCFMPVQTIPEVDVPFIDKWTHFALFGIFVYLWLLSFYRPNGKHFFGILITATVLGWLVETIQGSLKFLGRSKDDLDTVADAVGGVLGVIIFYLVYSLNKK